MAIAAAGMIAGFLSLGTLTYRLNRLEVPPMAVAVVSMVIFIGIQAALAAGYTGTPLLLWIAFGFFGTASTLSYAILSQAFPPGLAGRVNTAFNLLVFIAAFVMQWGLGAVIGLWPRTAAGGYAPVGYSAGLGLAVADAVVLYQAPDLGWSLDNVAATLGARGQVCHSLEATLAAIQTRLQPGTQVLIMSNGGFGGIHERLLQALRATRS